jgi:ABC-type nickel/cobalt efflux system permease component RcnA
VTTTLLLGVLIWIVGATLAVRYAHLVSLGSALALLAFGLWIAYGGWREARGERHNHAHFGHAHLHSHEDGLEHVHWHEHHEEDRDSAVSGVATPHTHDHTIAGRTALLLILGSSPMVEGIPAFLAASTKGFTLLAVMAIAFASATIATYVVMCVAGVTGLQRASVGSFERYGEVLSGLFVAGVGLYALLTS